MVHRPGAAGQADAGGFTILRIEQAEGDGLGVRGMDGDVDSGGGERHAQRGGVGGAC
jgi:hypothetical protein